MIGSLSLDQLRVLVAVADLGSFAAAGRRLGRVQSAMSQTIATLEAVQGVVLFDRSSHRPRLTDVGRVLVNQARLVLASAARFEAVAAGTREGLEPELALAIDPLVPTAPLIESLRALNELFPALPVSFSTEGLGGSLRRLRSGSAALAICLTPSIEMASVIGGRGFGSILATGQNPTPSGCDATASLKSSSRSRRPKGARATTLGVSR